LLIEDPITLIYSPNPNSNPCTRTDVDFPLVEEPERCAFGDLRTSDGRRQRSRTLQAPSKSKRLTHLLKKPLRPTLFAAATSAAAAARGARVVQGAVADAWLCDAMALLAQRDRELSKVHE
jgi:hypothetical protein